jgi:hypothetical protein
LGFDVRRGGEDEPFKDVRKGEGAIFDFLPGGGGGGGGGVWIFSGMTHYKHQIYNCSMHYIG